MKKLRLILGDQLNRQHSWFFETNTEVTYCMFEMRQETDYVTHHIQKVVGFFAAMRTFAQELQDTGHKVVYYRINDANNTQNLIENLTALLEEHQIEKLEYLAPDEYRLDAQLKSFCSTLNLQTDVFLPNTFIPKGRTWLPSSKVKNNF